jgi:hypothetical protein
LLRVQITKLSATFFINSDFVGYENISFDNLKADILFSIAKLKTGSISQALVQTTLAPSIFQEILLKFILTNQFMSFVSLLLSLFSKNIIFETIFSGFS